MTSLPPRTPYVKIRIFKLGANEPNKNPTDATILPAMVTALHPNLFTRPLAIGPIIN